MPIVVPSTALISHGPKMKRKLLNSLASLASPRATATQLVNITENNQAKANSKYDTLPKRILCLGVCQSFKGEKLIRRIVYNMTMNSFSFSY